MILTSKIQLPLINIESALSSVIINITRSISRKVLWQRAQIPRIWLKKVL